MLMDTNLDANQQDYAETAHASGRDLISLINEVLDQAKIESGRLELETVPFDLRSVLDNVLSLFSGKTNEKGIEVKKNQSVAFFYLFFLVLLIPVLTKLWFLVLFWVRKVGRLCIQYGPRSCHR